MNKILIWSITAALAGFLFGFDTVVISGADQKLQELWGSSDAFHGSIVMAMALWGTVIGALFGSIPTNKIGRKNTLIWIGIFYFVSAVGSSMVNDPWTFAFFRFLGGLGVGASRHQILETRSGHAGERRRYVGSLDLLHKPHRYLGRSPGRQ